MGAEAVGGLREVRRELRQGMAHGAGTMNEELFLVDFGNVPGVDLSQISTECRVIVFTGVGQKAVPLELVTATQRFGERLEWRRVDASGRNALDFFIACEVGRVQASGNGTSCTVLSNDKGFDPLLRHLNGAGVRCFTSAFGAEGSRGRQFGGRLASGGRDCWQRGRK